MNTTLLELFHRQVVKSFAFLSSDYGFAAPQVSIDEHISFGTITLKGKNIAIQLILDERAEDIDCKIARVINGEVTREYARNKGGALVRDSVFAILRRRGVRGSLFTKVSGRSFEERIPIVVEDFARMLKEYGQDMLADSPTVFA